MSNFAMYLYISLWAISFYVHYKRTKYLGAGGTILLMFLVYSLISFFVYSTSDYTQKPLRVLPFIYLFGCIIVASMPVLKYNESKVVAIDPPSPTFIHVFTYLYLFCALIRIPEVFSNMSTGITLILMDSDAGSQLYNDAHFAREASGGISNLFAIFYNVFADASIILFFYYWIFFPKRRITIIVFAISIGVQVLSQVSMGLRTETTLKALSVFIAYITMRRFMTKQQRRKIAIIGGGFLGLVLAVLLALSLSRFGEKEGGVSSGTLSYIAMGNLEFNQSVWDVEGTRNGDRTANTFKALLGFDVPKDIQAVRSRYSRLGVDDGVFYTFVGDFVLDYGKFMTVILFTFFSSIFCRITRPQRRHIKMHQLIALYFVMCVVVQGGFYLFSYSFLSNLVILGFLVLYLIFWFDSNSKKIKHAVSQEELCI